MKYRTLLLALACATAGCGDDGAAPDDAATPDASLVDAGPAELRADAGPSRYAVVGEEVVLDGSSSTGAVLYQWDYGDGRRMDAPSADPIARVTYGAPGRYRATLSVLDAGGARRTDGTVITVTDPLTHVPRASSTIAIDDETRRAVVVVPDNDRLAVVEWTDAEPPVFSASGGHGTCPTPRSVAIVAATAIVSCAGDSVTLVGLDSGATTDLATGAGTMPGGVIAAPDGTRAWVALQGTGQIAELRLDGASGATLADRFAAIEDVRHLALLPDGRIAASRLRSPDERGEIAVLDPDTHAREVWTLAYDPQPGSDTESGGVPSYLGPVVVAPTGRTAIVPSLQASIGEGLHRSERPLTFQTAVRAVISYLDPRSGTEDFPRRKQFDDRGFANAAVFSGHGDFAYVSMRGNRSIERIDALTGAQSGSVQDAGLAIEGVAIAQDRWLLVDATLSRELVVYDLSLWSSAPPPIARVRTVERDVVDARVLAGKRLFNDSADERLAKDGYIACAHCHLDGDSDRRVWDFTDRGEGLRNTISLLGRAGTGHGLLHWSANFDEVQDFEHDIRFAFMGTGLMSDAAFHTGTRDVTLGDPKAGLSADLDALAAYVTSLTAQPPSPFRAADGSLPSAAARGRAIFESASTGCTTCHAGERLTDSGLDAAGMPVLHDVGTLGAGSGGRLGGALPGIDTPTLHGLWMSPPYLHDGSAATLAEVLTTRNTGDVHGTTSTLDDAQLADLVAYLLCLDGRRD